MKRSRFSEEQIIGILKEHEAGVSVADLCRKHGAEGFAGKEVVTPAAERRAVAHLKEAFGMSERWACKAIGCCRATRAWAREVKSVSFRSSTA